MVAPSAVPGGTGRTSDPSVLMNLGFDSPSAPFYYFYWEIMKEIYSKLGGLSDLRRIVDLLQDFTGFIKVDRGMLFYIDSKLILSLWRDDPVDIRGIFKKLPEEFLIEVYRCSKEELREIMREKVGEDLLFKLEEDPSVRYVSLDSYNSIYNYIDSKRYEVVLIPKRYCSDRGIVVFENMEEILSVYRSKNRALEGSRAISRIKSIFAVSEMRGFIREISEEEVKRYMETYPGGVLKRSVSLEDLIKEVKSKEPVKVIYNDSLMDVLTEEPSLIEIDGRMYIVSKDKKVVYAFFGDYRGDKAYRYIKNYCLFRDVEIKVYSLTKDEYKILGDFKDIRVKGS